MSHPRLSASNSQHDPYNIDILRVGDDLCSDGVACLVPSHEEDLLADWRCVDVGHDSVCVEVSELDGESFEGVAIWDVVLDALLELS